MSGRPITRTLRDRMHASHRTGFPVKQTDSTSSGILDTVHLATPCLPRYGGIEDMFPHRPAHPSLCFREDLVVDPALLRLRENCLLVRLLVAGFVQFILLTVRHDRVVDDLRWARIPT